MITKKLAAVAAAIALTTGGVAQAQNPAASLSLGKSARAGTKSAAGEHLATTGGTLAIAVALIVIVAVTAAVASEKDGSNNSDSN